MSDSKTDPSTIDILSDNGLIRTVIVSNVGQHVSVLEHIVLTGDDWLTAGHAEDKPTSNPTDFHFEVLRFEPQDSWAVFLGQTQPARTGMRVVDGVCMDLGDPIEDP